MTDVEDCGKIKFSSALVQQFVTARVDLATARKTAQQYAMGVSETFNRVDPPLLYLESRQSMLSGSESMNGSSPSPMDDSSSAAALVHTDIEDSWENISKHVDKGMDFFLNFSR